MFVSFGKKCCFLIFVLFLHGCFASSDVNGGFDPGETLWLDDDFSEALSIEKDETFALDVRVPEKKGYRLVGASFDPTMLRLEHYLTYDDDGEPRARYIFTALGNGTSDVLVKMEPVSGGDPEVYRMVSVNVSEDDGLF